MKKKFEIPGKVLTKEDLKKITGGLSRCGPTFPPCPTNWCCEGGVCLKCLIP